MPRHVQRTPITPIQSQAITAGWAGLVLLFLALITWYATGVREWYTTALLVVAGLALADWLVYASPLVLERFSRRQLLAELDLGVQVDEPEHAARRARSVRGALPALRCD